MYHHAIVTSDAKNGNCRAIHFNGGQGHLAGVKDVELQEDSRFHNLTYVYCVNRGDYYSGLLRINKVITGSYSLERTPQDVVAWAKKVSVRPAEYGFKASDYRGHSNNCEHFCTFCCTGERYCYQFQRCLDDVRAALALPVIGAAIAAAATAAAPVAAPVAAASAGSFAILSAVRGKQWLTLFDRGKGVSEASSQ